MSGVSKTEWFLNRASMLLLIGAGIFFIYEGAILVDVHRQNPEKVPGKVAVAGSLTIVLGVVSLVFAVLHFFIDGSASEFFKKMKIGVKNSN